ncbi:MAG: hypothetical protein QM401_00335 [Bacillota bacterium]|nr:hypothetical protein [Bacillota bacterium]
MTTQRRSLLISTVVLIFLLSGAVHGFAQDLDLNFIEVDYNRIFEALGESQGLNVLVDSSVVGKGTFQLKGVTFEEALDLISYHSGFVYRIQRNTLLVATPDRLARLEDKDVRYVQVNSLGTADIYEAISLVMPRDDIYIHPEGGLVILHGPKSLLDRAEELLMALDASEAPAGHSVPASTGTPRKAYSLLRIFQDISDEMNLSLIADPALESESLYLEVSGKKPLELIKQIQKLIPVRVEITDDFLVVGSIDGDAAQRNKVYRLDYADPASVEDALSTFIESDRIRIDEANKSVTVRGTELDLMQVDEFLVDFDQPLPQVVMELWVQETSKSATRELGVEWSGLITTDGGAAPTFLELDWDPRDLITALKAMENRGESKLLANPKITTLSGMTGQIFVGDKVPIVLRNEDGSHSVDYLEAGIDLKVTPRISDDGYITILIQPMISTFSDDRGTGYPSIRTREAETTVRVKDGQPFVLGGLIQDQEDMSIGGLPIISKLPVLGQLFQWKKTTKDQTEMTIFVIPHIVQSGQGFELQEGDLDFLGYSK